MDKQSIPDLISTLCRTLFKSIVNVNNLQEKEINAIVSHLKSKSFHILLNDKWQFENSDFGREFHNDIETELLICEISFLKNHNRQKAEKFKKCISNIDVKANENILKLLLLLSNQNICHKDEDEDEIPNFSDRKIYEYVPEIYPHFHGINTLKLSKFNDSPYIDQNLLDIQPLGESFLFQNDVTCNFLYPNFQKNENTIDYIKSSSQYQFKNENIWDTLLSENCIWENLEDSDDFLNNRNTLFESNVDIIYVLWKIILRNRSNLVSRNIESETFNVISVDQFLIDAKNLLVGIESNSFRWSEEDDKFIIKTGLCVKGILPHTFHRFCEDLIMAGTLFTRLYALLLTPNKENGYTFNDLCLKLPKFFNFYRSNVLLFNGNSLSDFKMYTRKLLEIIQSVARCFFQNIEAKQIWTGIDLFNNIYQEFSRTTKNDYLFIVHYFLFHCYQNYFRRFIKPWIMDGNLIDPYNEFFIKKNTNFTHYRNRKYWTQGFKISSETTIPLFLKEYLNLILLCGKSVCLVKHCFQDSDLPQIESKSMEMDLCASENQLAKLKVICDQNYEHGLTNTASIASFQNIFDTKIQKADELKTRAAETQVSTLLNIQKQIQTKRELRMEEKRKLWDEVEKERKTSQLLKDLMISQEIRTALVEYNEEKHYEKEKQRLINLEKEELITKYANLTKTLDLKHSFFDNRIALLQAYLNKTALTLPLTNITTSESNTIESIMVENITNSNNQITSFDDENKTKLSLYGLGETKLSFNDNLTTPTNNNLAWNIMEMTTNIEEKGTTIERQIAAVKDKVIDESNEQINYTIIEETVETVPIRNDISKKIPDLTNPYIDNKFNYDIEKLDEISETKWDALNYERKIDPMDVKLENLEKQNHPIKPFDVLKIIYSYSNTITTNDEKVPETSIPNLNLEFDTDFNLSNCKLFDLHAEQSLLMPLNTQLTMLNTRLMQHFLNDYKILQHFHTLGDFYFFFNSEYKHNFTKQLFELLYYHSNYPKEVFNLKTLYEIVQFSVNTYHPNQNNNEFKDRISLQLITMPSVLNLQSVDLLNCLSLTYQVEWPLNIIFTDKVLQKYNKIFQYLLKLRRVQWVLNDLLYKLKFAQKEMNFDDIKLMRSPHFKGIQLMRHIMNTWLTLMLCHVTEVVLHSSWYEFEKDLTKAATIDDIYHTHKQFIKDAVFRCSLNDNSEFYMQNVNKAFELIFQFHDLFSNRQFHLKDEQYLHPNYYKLQLCFSNFKEMMRYIIKLCEKQVRKEYQPHLDQIINILNFNNYFD